MDLHPVPVGLDLPSGPVDSRQPRSSYAGQPTAIRMCRAVLCLGGGQDGSEPSATLLAIGGSMQGVTVRRATVADIDGLVASITGLFAEDGVRDELRNRGWPAAHAAGR